MRILIFILMMSSCATVLAQDDIQALVKANKLYRQKQFDLSLPEYRKAVTSNPSNSVAQYNFGNVLFRKEQWSEAEVAYNNAMEYAKTTTAKEKAVYNKGVSFSRQKKLEESIQAYKSALKLDPNDEDARVNLQKALLELRKQQQSGDKSEKKQQQNQQPKPQPKQNQSKLNKKQVEQLLKALRQKEQEVQQKMQQQRTRTTTNPEKDW